MYDMYCVMGRWIKTITGETDELNPTCYTCSMEPYLPTNQPTSRMIYREPEVNYNACWYL